MTGNRSGYRGSGSVWIQATRRFGAYSVSLHQRNGTEKRSCPQGDVFSLSTLRRSLHEYHASGVKQRGSKFNHKLIATELGFRGRCGLLDELCVDGLSVVVVVMFAYDGFSGVGLDAAIEYGIHKFLFRLEQQDGLGCTWHECAVEHITDVMCARLRENRAIPVVEMLVVLEDKIDTTVSPNPLSEVIETVGVRSCSCGTTRGRSLSNWVVPNSTGRGSKTVDSCVLRPVT